MHSDVTPVLGAATVQLLSCTFIIKNLKPALVSVCLLGDRWSAVAQLAGGRWSVLLFEYFRALGVSSSNEPGQWDEKLKSLCHKVIILHLRIRRRQHRGRAATFPHVLFFFPIGTSCELVWVMRGQKCAAVETSHSDETSPSVRKSRCFYLEGERYSRKTTSSCSNYTLHMKYQRQAQYIKVNIVTEQFVPN